MRWGNLGVPLVVTLCVFNGAAAVENANLAAWHHELPVTVSFVQSPRDPSASGTQRKILDLIESGILPVPPSMHIRWEREFHVGLTGDEIERMRSEVSGKPDHPDRDQFLEAERRMNRGPDRVICDVYTGTNGEFRYSETRSDGTTLDVVFAGNTEWLMTSDHLRLSRADDLTPGRSLIAHKRNAERQVAQFQQGALALLTGLPESSFISFRQEGQQWQAVVEIGGGIALFAVDGQVIGGQPLALNARLRDLPSDPSAIGTTAKSLNVWNDSPLGLIARICEEYSARGVLQFRNKLLDAGPLPPGDWFSTPGRESKTDAHRGEIVINSILDYRESESGASWSRAEAGERWVRQDAPPDQIGRSRWLLDRLGYIVVGGVALVLVGIWLLRRRSVDG